MRHVPHVVIAAPWPDEKLPISVAQWRHLTKVLRLGRGDTITYTDGLGTIGSGRLGDRTVTRSEEEKIPRGPELIVAAAPPANKDRQRFLVEKLTELEVAQLVWLRTRHGKNRLASPSKVFSWVLAATEQARGAWLMDVGDSLVTWDDLESPVAVCHPGGDQTTPQPRTVVVGPEGGFAPDEIPADLTRWDLGRTVLRVETAAVVASSRILG